MREVLVVAPVTAAEVVEAARRYVEELAAGTDIRADVVGLRKGPASVETFFDEAFAAPGVLDVVVRAAGRYQGVIVNCFADPGVEAARELVDIPVVGPAEASMLLALTLGHKFAVVSTFANSGPWVERQARAWGLSSRLAWATGVEMPVLELAADSATSARLIGDACLEAVRRRGAEVIVLGCTAMAGLAETIRRRLAEEGLDVPVIEPLAAAFRMLQALLELGWKRRAPRGGSGCAPGGALGCAPGGALGRAPGCPGR